MYRRAALGSILAVPTLAAPVYAQSWPDRPVRIIVPYPPGGSNDTVARIVQPRLQEILGKPVIIDNRAGASGSVGSSETARSAPDGHTWLLANDTLASNDTLMNLPYRVMEAFTFCSLLGTCPYAMTAHPGTPFRSLAQMIEAAKAAPDTLSYATTGVGSLAHIATVLLQQRGDFKISHVPYRGGGPALQDALAGHVPLFMSNIVIILQHIREGRLMPLGVSSAQPSSFLPNVPTFASQGFPGFEALTYWVMVGPAGIPEAITNRFQAALKQVLSEAQVQTRMAEQGADIVASSPAETTAFIRNEITKWGDVIRANNIRAES
ncbi:Bug family tripartite tricarboxylate transporter substrate binding protein [Roseococcus pinisoli]|uniref:Tripartite tricarboxylate transporter substrate binding protein n=1 Tax=Roseococcus pinisoli TaxID=2835040 RepID=A0ABS5QGR6_9PROT|nr:tripartite tricarboxylate transporter substrate binding protein [Roseococcus pinisoli]MBS7812880.1 tripartite tricarboxylate transporter substrate binding protein [Roseococcus pinisoli]